MDIRIEGLYDKRTIDFLIENQIRHFGFNFSPKNLNFLQHREFTGILSDMAGPKYAYYLNVSYDSPVVINHLLEKTQKEIHSQGHLAQTFPLYIELADEDCRKIDELNLSRVNGVFWHYCPGIHSLSEILSIPELKGIFLNYGDIKQMHEDQSLFSFVQNFSAHFYSPEQSEKSLQLGIRADWDADFFPSLFELFDFDILSFGVSSQVEICFRNVDLNKIGQELGHIRQISID